MSSNRLIAWASLDNFTFVDNAAHFFQNRVAHIALLANDLFVLVMRIVRVAELSVGTELKLQKLMPKLACVPHAVPDRLAVLIAREVELCLTSSERKSPSQAWRTVRK